MKSAMLPQAGFVHVAEGFSPAEGDQFKAASDTALTTCLI
jgi:hypothetical protein